SAIAVVVIYIIIQKLESYVLQPTIMKHQVSLLPAATLVSQLFFATFFGPVGLVLALPLTVVSRVWIEEAWIKDYLDDTSIAEDGANPPSAATPMTQTNSPDQTLGQETSQTVRKDTPSSLSE
ncbi:MAG: AI-2E family transporter, partial [Cyanobacteria bacterium J06639_16]